MVARMRVATSGTIALSDDYGNSAPTAGHVLTSLGAGLPPDWAPATAAIKPVNQVLFVDGVNGEAAATADGTLAHPFRLIQDALTYGTAQGWNAVQLQCAAGFYPDPIYIADTYFAVTFAAWEPTGGVTPFIGGDTIVIENNALGATLVSFYGCTVQAVSIAAGAVDHDMNLLFERCLVLSNISGADIYVETHEAILLGLITGTTTLTVKWDGPSWAYYLQGGAPAHNPPTYVYDYADDGHDIYNVTLQAAAVALGATVFLPLIVSPTTVQGDHAQLRTDDPEVQDFICGVLSTDNGVVVAWLTNISRNGGGGTGDFNEAAQVLVHHNAMQLAPAP